MWTYQIPDLFDSWMTTIWTIMRWIRWVDASMQSITRVHKARWYMMFAAHFVVRIVSRCRSFVYDRGDHDPEFLQFIWMTAYLFSKIETNILFKICGDFSKQRNKVNNNRMVLEWIWTKGILCSLNLVGFESVPLCFYQNEEKTANSFCLTIYLCLKSVAIYSTIGD